ncbi:MAG TPA: RidA family protein [Corynebacteriales bacterium]|nr:RidA family protein [Mycobacteriales bacterium]
MDWEKRLGELGIKLPEVAAPVAAYVPAKRSGNFVYTSGQLAFVDGKLGVTGKVGDDVSPEQAYAEARLAALNGIAAAAAVVGLNNIKSVVKVTGFVNSAKGFNGQAGVINGASELLGLIFEQAGQHARSAVGVAELPLDAPVEVELIFEVSD